MAMRWNQPDYIRILCRLYLPKLNCLHPMLKASALEFRLRFVLGLVIYVLGFIAPWNSLLHLDSIRTWQFLAAWPARSGWIGFSAATILILVLGILCASV